MLVEEALGIAHALLVKHLRTFEVVTDDEEETEIEAANHVHHKERREAGGGAGLIDRKNRPPRRKEHPGETVKDSLSNKKFRHGLQMRTVPQVHEGANNILCAEEEQQTKQVQMLHGLVAQSFLRWVQSQHRGAEHIWVVLHVVAVDMMLHHVLMDPINSAATDPILR